MIQTLDLTLVGPAFVAGLLVLATHVPLGLQVLKRGIVFIDLAIAQVAGLGVIVADLFGWEPGTPWAQVAALCAALAGALLLTWTERRWPEIQEALIGTLFVLAATGATLLLANNAHGGEHLKDLLVGQILWVSSPQLIAMAAVTVLVLATRFLAAERGGPAVFYLTFAVSVTASVQLVGVYLVFASLIVPALVARRLKRATIAGYAIGAAGYGIGLLISVAVDLPPGPVIVWTLVALALLAAAAARLRARRPERR